MDGAYLMHHFDEVTELGRSPRDVVRQGRSVSVYREIWLWFGRVEEVRGAMIFALMIKLLNGLRAVVTSEDPLQVHRYHP